MGTMLVSVGKGVIVECNDVIGPDPTRAPPRNSDDFLPHSFFSFSDDSLLSAHTTEQCRAYARRPGCLPSPWLRLATTSDLLLSPPAISFPAPHLPSRHPEMTSWHRRAAAEGRIRQPSLRQITTSMSGPGSCRRKSRSGDSRRSGIYGKTASLRLERRGNLDDWHNGPLAFQRCDLLHTLSTQDLT
jgi:hypothetical protein